MHGATVQALATSTPGGQGAGAGHGTPGGHSGTSSNAQGFALRRGADVGIRSGQGLRLVQGATVQAFALNHTKNRGRVADSKEYPLRSNSALFADRQQSVKRFGKWRG